MLALMAFGARVAQATDWPTMQNLKAGQTESIYDRPYSLWESDVNEQAIYRNTAALFGGGVAAMGILYLMPSSFTNWDGEDNDRPWKKWGKNVSRAPVWDKDDVFLNYVTHPYFGGVYYMGARSAGAGAGYAFLYSAALSTFFWEYGLEAFAERPSIQDLIVTPVGGAIVGEGFYLAKRHILEHDRMLWGSTALGETALFLMDPITEVTEWIFDDAPANNTLSVAANPNIGPRGFGYGVRLSVAF